MRPPMPVEIEELSAVKCLVDNGFVVVTVGGGGIPVIRNDKGELEGTAAVIDKDLCRKREAGGGSRMPMLWLYLPL